MNQMPLLLLLLLLSVTDPLPANEFKVAAGSGEVGKSAKAYTPAQVNSTYPLNYWARTGGDALRIEFNPQNIFRLLPRSEVQVSGSGAANSTFRRVLNLKSGSVELDLPQIKSTNSKVEVQTPTAICGAVGTRFTVNADNGQFNVAEGTIFARAEGDAGFVAQSVRGSFTLNPGKENAYSDVAVSGSFVLNGQSFNANNVSIQIAKGKGGASPAAVRINSGSLDGVSGGSYLMEGGRLAPVEPAKAQLHSSYLQATQTEGQLNVQIESRRASGQPVSAAQNAQLNAAARSASELRAQLFQRGVIRDAAKEAVRQSTGVARPRF
ncbi:MAG: FecR domain-containing protein [Blastochloris sp.]|nr:FecR domain-containing protein [Blastochloris sp.]